MRFKLTVLALLCFFLCLCNGGPRKQNTGESSTAVRWVRYTNEEDKFIVKEVSKRIGEYKSVKSREMWTKIAKKHRAKWIQKACGFPQERSTIGLRSHFEDVLLTTHALNDEKVPKDLLEKLVLLRETKLDRGRERLRLRSYTAEEENLIIDELLKPIHVNLFGASTLKAITEKFAEKYQSKAPGFVIDRTTSALRTHMFEMRRKRQFPNELMKKFLIFEKSTKSSSSSPQNQQTDLQFENAEQITNREQDEDDWVQEMVSELRNRTDPQTAYSK